MDTSLDVMYEQWGEFWQEFAEFAYSFDVSPMRAHIDGYQNVTAMPLLIAVAEVFDWPYITINEVQLEGIEKDKGTGRFLTSQVLKLRNPSLIAWMLSLS